MYPSNCVFWDISDERGANFAELPFHALGCIGNRTRKGLPSMGKRAYTVNLDEAAKGKVLMAEQRHGRYYAQELMLDQATSQREQIQDALDVGDSKEWHLVAMSDALVEGGVLLWDTAWPQLGGFAGQAE